MHGTNTKNLPIRLHRIATQINKYNMNLHVSADLRSYTRSTCCKCASECPNIVGKTIVLLLDLQRTTAKGFEFYINDCAGLVAVTCALHHQK